MAGQPYGEGNDAGERNHWNRGAAYRGRPGGAACTAEKTRAGRERSRLRSAETAAAWCHITGITANRNAALLTIRISTASRGFFRTARRRRQCP